MVVVRDRANQSGQPIKQGIVQNMKVFTVRQEGPDGLSALKSPNIGGSIIVIGPQPGEEGEDHHYRQHKQVPPGLIPPLTDSAAVPLRELCQYDRGGTYQKQRGHKPSSCIAARTLRTTPARLKHASICTRPARPISSLRIGGSSTKRRMA